MSHVSITRRDWVLGLSATTVAQIAAAQQHAHDAMNAVKPPRLQTLDPATAAELDALTSQIIPSEPESPGAHEAGVVFFIDCALTTFESDKRDDYRTGLQAIHQTRAKLFPDSRSIAALSPAQQIELLRAIEKSEFFELLRTHTVWGFVGAPSYGGNRNKVGWTHIHFDDRMQFQPPFGYYDAEAKGGDKP